MAEGVKFMDLPVETSLDGSDGLLIGSNATSMIKRTNLEAVAKYIADILYPVGAYIQIEDADYDPNTSLAGEWEKVSGVFLYAADTSHAVGTTGGNNAVMIDKSNLPEHLHSLPEHTHTGPEHVHVITETSVALKTSAAGEHQHKIPYEKDAASGSSKNRFATGGSVMSAYVTSADGKHEHTIAGHSHEITCGKSGSGITGSGGGGSTGKTGNNKQLNIMPKYRAVAMWKRVR